MKILVTGADGQLGMSLRKIAGEYPRHLFVFAGRAEADICDFPSLRRTIGDSGAELIINCAAYTYVDRAESEPAAAKKINRDGAANLARIAREFAIPLIHISTDYVFGGSESGSVCGSTSGRANGSESGHGGGNGKRMTENRPFTEENVPDPRCVYGRTKLAGEEAIRASGCDAAVIRTSWLFSEFGHNFVRTMLRLGASGKVLRVVDDQTGCPTYAEDLARAIIRISENGVRGFEVYNFCNAGSTTWYGFACEIFRLAGMDVRVEPVATADYPTVACRPAYSVLSTGKIRRAGVQVPPWRDALARCLEQIEKQ